MADKQLFHIIPQMELSHYYNSNRGELVLREANNMPFLRWPDGTPCIAINAYMIHLLQRNLSRNNAGGSLRTYAQQLSHLIRFNYKNSLNFYDMNHGSFTKFIGELRETMDLVNPNVRKRDSNTLNAIGRKSLDFLDFVGCMNGEEGFVTGVIKAEKRSYAIKARKSKTGLIKKSSWWHPSFDTPDPKKKRNAISKQSIEVLYDAIPGLVADSSSLEVKRFFHRRRTIMIRLLEMTGARIEEIARIQVEDIDRALNQKYPELRLETLKKGYDSERLIPVLHQDLAAIKPYIRLSRAKVIKDAIGTSSDHGFLFIGVRGRPLKSKYMSNEIGLLRRNAGLSEQACAHMFRHRFITKLFVRYINQYEFDNKDDFRRALIDAHTLKQQVQQYTGHGRVESLDTYIDLAFEEVANLGAITSAVILQGSYESFDANVELLHNELELGLPVSVYLERYRELLELRVADIDRAGTLEQNGASWD